MADDFVQLLRMLYSPEDWRYLRAKRGFLKRVSETPHTLDGLEEMVEVGKSLLKRRDLPMSRS